MNTRPKVHVWAVRKDGWMRRMEFDLPLVPRFQIREPIGNLADALKAAEGPLDENVVMRTRCFELHEVGNHDFSPWGEPCFYKEI